MTALSGGSLHKSMLLVLAVWRGNGVHIYIQGLSQTLLSNKTYIKYICHRNVKQYNAVGTLRMFIEPSAKHLLTRLTHSPCATKTARVGCNTMLSTIFKCQDVQHTCTTYVCTKRIVIVTLLTSLIFTSRRWEKAFRCISVTTTTDVLCSTWFNCEHVPLNASCNLWPQRLKSKPGMHCLCARFLQTKCR